MTESEAEKDPYHTLVDEALQLHAYVTGVVQDHRSILPDLMAATYFALALPKVAAKLAAATKDSCSSSTPGAPEAVTAAE